MPRMRTRAYNARNTVMEKVSSYKVTNDIPLSRGRVIDNNDPKGIGRIKVRIYSINGDEFTGASNEDLPWAYPCFFNASYDSGSFIVPEVGNVVWCLFEDGDKSKPVYLGGMYGIGVQNSKAVGNTGGEFRYQRLNQKEIPVEVLSVEDKVVYKSPKGASIIIRESVGEEKIEITDQLGQKIIMSSPFRDDVSIANLSSLDKRGLLSGEASIIIKTINDSILSLSSDSEESRVELDLKGSKEVKLVSETKEGNISFEVDGSSINISDKIDIDTGNERVVLDNGQISLKASTVKIDADTIILGDEVNK